MRRALRKKEEILSAGYSKGKITLLHKINSLFSKPLRLKGYDRDLKIFPVAFFATAIV